MGSEIFKLKSLYMDDTVVRGSRLSIKNAKETKTILTNPGNDPQVKTGETGVNVEYIIQSSLIGNDLKGQGTFTNNSDVVRDYSGPQNIKHNDIIRLDSDITFYNVTGIQGTDIYLQEKYVKKDTSTPDVQTGPATVRKVKLDSVQYEKVRNPEPSTYIYYDKDNTTWGVTDAQFSGPFTAPTAAMFFETGMNIQFLPGTSSSKPDLLTIGSVYKTLVDNNSSPIADISLSPLPYPHESLQVYEGPAKGKLDKKIEGEDYVVNYSQSPEYKTPRPPYEERQGAYLKFLDKLTNEVQVPSINATFEGNVAITKQTGGTNLVTPVSDIIPGDKFSIKVGDAEKRTNAEYIANYAAGIVTFVKHRNSEYLIDNISYIKKIIWDGISVIKGVPEGQVQNVSSLVIPPISGLAGVSGMVCYEDTDQNNLIRDTDYTIDPESGAIGLTTPLKSTESVLVSYYVEGEDVTEEAVALNDMRVNKYPVISGSVTITKKYRATQDNQETTSTKILIEGQDYTFYYTTGRISLLNVSAEEELLSLQANYTPMAQINCILQSVPGDNLKYRMTVVDDIVKVVDVEKLIFKINNPVVSAPVKNLFPDQSNNKNYTFSGTVLPGSLLWVKNESGTKNFDVTGYGYEDLSRQIDLDETLSAQRPETEELIVATYSFESEVLPYAPAIILNVIFNSGDDGFIIEGFNRTDTLKEGMILRVDNFDPEHTFYFKIKEVSYKYGNTLVKLYGSFSETIINPTFYLFDDTVTWVDLPSGTTIDTTAPIQAESIILHGNPLQISQSIKKDTMLMINDQQIYSVSSVTTDANKTTIGIFPFLEQPVTGTIRYSSLPVHTEGDTRLPSQYLTLLSPTQPAFTLSYQAPTGFEGSAKILIDNKKIVITEAIRGIMNPVAYTYTIADYTDLYSLAKAIQATPSTYRTNVPWAGVPDYNPFTISPAGGAQEDYYLSAGAWSADLIIPFEDSTPIDLPYTIQIVPELFKWTLLQAFVSQSSFLIKNADRTGMFLSGNLLAFRSRIDGKIYFFEVDKSKLVDDPDDSTKKNTEVDLKDSFRVNLLNPTVYKYDSVSWVDTDNRISDFDYDQSTLTFAGAPQGNLRKGTLLQIGGRYIYQVTGVTVDTDSYTIKMSPDLSTGMSLESYPGFIKQSTVPVYLDDTGPQPFMALQYTVPKGHTGSAKIKVDVDSVTLVETVDNFSTKSTTLFFEDYADIIELSSVLKDVPSYVTPDKPYTVVIPETYVASLKGDGFSNFKLRPTYGSFVALPSNILIAVSAFEINYTAPAGYVGDAEVKISDTRILLKETIVNYHAGQDVSKEIRIDYAGTKDLQDIALNLIPAITSLVPGDVKPYSCTLLNGALFDRGPWGSTHVVPYSEDYLAAPVKVSGAIDGAYWYVLGPLNERRLVQGTDYTIETGTVTLTSPIIALDRFRYSYMGLWNLAEDEGSSVTCSCRYFTTLSTGSRVDVYMDYLNIDQFYLQKLTERLFSQIVVAPQITEILSQMGSGGQSNDSGANNNAVQNYAGGLADLNYALRDEQIKKQLYLRFYQWYKDRLRYLSAELQLTLGFKFAHSNSLGLNNGQYTLEDEYVEDEDYTLTKDEDIDQISNGFSDFFPIGYDGTAPKYYDRFGREYLSYNSVYCCNIKRTNADGSVSTVGMIKSENPYWNRGLDFVVWDDAYVTKNLVANYSVDVPAADRTFSSGTYTFLKRVSVGDKVRVSKYKDYYEIDQIVSPPGKNYEYLILKTAFTSGLKKKKKKRGIKTFDVHLGSDGQSVMKNRAGTHIYFDQLMDALPPDGFSIYVQRQEKEPFPMADDYGSLGASAYGEQIEGQVTNTRRIKKPFLKLLLALLFPLSDSIAEETKNFKIQVKKDSEGPWEDFDPIDLSKLSFKEERNVDDVLDSLRYDFTEIASLPGKKFYDIKEDETKGFHQQFYLSFEKIYDADTPGGYFEGIVLRAKDRAWWFRIVDGGTEDIIDNYGFDSSNEYRNFYDPDNIFKKMLKEKQAWETESLIIKDLYDHSDKLARAFDQGDMNRANSRYQGYLAKQDISTLFTTTFSVTKEISGIISDILTTGINIPSGTFVTVSSTGGTLPVPLKEGTVYYVINTGDKKCRLATVTSNSQQGSDVNITAGGTKDSSKKTDTVPYSLKMDQANPEGISDILTASIPAYEPQLGFLIDGQGPVYRTLYPDLVHPEDSASRSIAATYQQTSMALGIYSGAWQKEQFFKNLNYTNNSTWKNDYIRWVLGFSPGLIYQKDAKQMYEQNLGVITVGLKELPALRFRLVPSTVFSVENATLTVSWDNSGKYIRVIFDVVNIADPSDVDIGVSVVFKLYDIVSVKGIDTLIYKMLGEVCADINAYRFYKYSGVPLFSCEDIFAYYEYNITSKMLAVYGIPVDVATGAVLSVTTVEDHRSSDPRVLFLNKGIEDRLYTHVIRNIPAFNLGYTGDYYRQSLDGPAIQIINIAPMPNMSYSVNLDGAGKKQLVIKYGAPSLNLSAVFPIYNASTDTYKTLSELAQSINGYLYRTYNIFRATVLYTTYPAANLSADCLSLCNDFISATLSAGHLTNIVYVHVQTGLDDIDPEINQGIYRVFYDTDARKKLEIRFNEIIVNGSRIEETRNTGARFVIDFQNPDGTFKTLTKFCTDVSVTEYKYTKLFTATPAHTDSPEATQYIIVDNTDRFLGFDKSDTVYMDTYTVDINDPATARSVLNTQNAYFSHPIYTSNGNPNKLPIDGIPVSGEWDTTVSEQVLSLSCKNGTTWEMTFNDYESGSNKSFKPTQEIINLIDTAHSLTEGQFQSIGNVEDRPVVAMIKELVLRRTPYADVTIISEIFTVDISTDELSVALPDWSVGDVVKFITTGTLPDPFVVNNIYYVISKTGTGNSIKLKVSSTSGGPVIDITTVGTGIHTVTRQSVNVLKISLRENDTINKLAAAINNARFNTDGQVDSDPDKGIIQYFTATVLGDTAIQGEYKSYELAAEYLPIIRSFSVVSATGSTFKQNYLIGWEIATTNLTVDQTDALTMSAKRYSPGDTYKFTVSPPDVAYTDTLLNNPQGFRRDILAFDVYCWDISGYFEIKDNWIYFRSALVGYTAESDMGQPDKTIGHGIPLAGSGHALAPANESIGALVARMNADSVVKKYFYVKLNFSRYQDATQKTLPENPGFFEYGYLPNYHVTVPQSQLDKVMLRNDSVMTLGPGVGYQFTASSYAINDAADTMDLSCSWQYSYEYSKEYVLTSALLDTISELVGVINTETAPYVSTSIFEAYVVGTHGSDASNTLMTGTGVIEEKDEHFTANVFTNQLSVSRTDWAVNDVVRFSSTFLLPTPLVAGTDYYVVSKTGTGTSIKLRVSTTFGGSPVDILTPGAGIHTIHRRYTNIYIATAVSAIQIKVRNLTGVNFSISSASFNRSPARNSLILRCRISYNDTSSFLGQNINMTMKDLAQTISDLRGYTDSIFPPLFSSTVINDMYLYMGADRLLDVVTGTISPGTVLYAHLNDLVAMYMLNMNAQANYTVTNTVFTAASYKRFHETLPADKDLHSWIDSVIMGDYTTGMVQIDILPIKVEAVDYGLLEITPQTQMVTGNTPAHGYFGILGDIQWIQISDQNLHVQLNYIKERLGQPWKDAQGNVLLDNYTPERFDTRPGYNNFYAIDMSNFLGYMKTVRYNQIKNSFVNEAIVNNNYFWLYMKFHKEFGCDQRVIALQKQIASKSQDQETIGDLG